jgi:hypothetical protein
MTGMRYLGKTLWAVGLIIVMQLLKPAFDMVYARAGIFNHNLLSCIQVAILLWLFISIVTELLHRKKNGPVKIARKNLLILFLLLAIPEVVATYWLHHPSQIPSFLLPTFRDYYGGAQRNIIQFNPACSVYDSSLFYTLKPSARFVYKNYEFADSFYTNKKGLRDDDNSLLAPGVICIGDSYAMGWGVKQKETFPELLERMSGDKILNAAISSYGTARELKNLYRLDTSALRCLIIQHSRNDATENADFVNEHFSLKLSSKETYYKTANMHYWNKLWFPGKHFITMGKMYVAEKIPTGFTRKEKTDTEQPSVTVPESARHFADILLHSAINFKKVKVIVTDVNEENAPDSFLAEVSSLITNSPYKEYFNNHLIIVPVADLFQAKDYYILDRHLRASGHQKIADRLYPYLVPAKYTHESQE